MVPLAHRRPTPVEPTVGRLPPILRRIVPICMTPDRKAADQRSALPPWTAGDSSIRMDLRRSCYEPHGSARPVDRGRCPSAPRGHIRVEPTVGRLPRIARRILPMCMAPDRRAADQRSALPPWSAGDSSIRMDRGRRCCEPHGSARPVDRGRCPSAPRGHIPGRADRWSAAVHRAADRADVHGAGSEGS